MKAEIIQKWIVDYIAANLGIDHEYIDVKTSFVNAGLDSVTAVSLICDLEELLGIELPTDVFYDLPSIEDLSQRLASQFITQ